MTELVGEDKEEERQRRRIKKHNKRKQDGMHRTINRRERKSNEEWEKIQEEKTTGRISPLSTMTTTTTIPYQSYLYNSKIKIILRSTLVRGRIKQRRTNRSSNSDDAVILHPKMISLCCTVL